jgi:hypothetical protein
MRGASDPFGMNERLTRIDIDALVAEIQRYLAAVDAFRAAGCPLRWRREPRMSAV